MPIRQTVASLCGFSYWYHQGILVTCGTVTILTQAAYPI